MNKLLKKLSCVIGIAMMFTVVSPTLPIVAEAKEQTLNIDGMMYEFGKKSEYEIDSSTPSDNTDKDLRLGTLSISGNIKKSYQKNGVAAYEIADDEVFSLEFKYISSLKDAGKDDWHLIEDGKDVVNGSELDDDIDFGAILLQTSFDGDTWVDCKSYVNVNEDKKFGKNRSTTFSLQTAVITAS